LAGISLSPEDSSWRISLLMLSLKGVLPPVTRRKHGLCCLRPRRSPPLAFHDGSRGMRLRRFHPDQIEGPFPAQPPVKPVGRVAEGAGAL